MAEQWIANLRLEELNGISLLVRVILCIVLGGILGMERTRKRRPAGMRTYMLVCLGSAAAMMTGIYMYDAYGGGFDPSRIAAQVVTGVGFLGAGTILTTRYHRVKGLTTAAGLWVAACLGLAIGAGWYLGSVVIALASLFIMVFADRIERAYAYGSKQFRAHIILREAAGLHSMLAMLGEMGIAASDIEMDQAVEGQEVDLCFTLKSSGKFDHAEVIRRIASLEEVLLAEEQEYPQ